VLNIDESRARVRCLAREQVIVLLDIKEIYTISLKNRKLVIVIETVYTNGRDPLPLFVIIPGKKIIDS
jgi:hypothetical protein